MTTGTVLSVVHDGVTVTARVQVTESDGGVNVYTATLDYPTFAALANDAARLSALVDAWNIVRDARLAIVAGITKISTWNDDEVTLT